ncbi:MAG: DUF952 domain-containing protein [Pseudomonadota bacterium]
MLILKIFRQEEWRAFRQAGVTQGAPIDLSDGFIHFSTPQQAAETAALHFAGEKGLMLLAVDASSVGDALKWEVSRGGAEFPHLFRELRLQDLERVEPLPLIAGRHRFPEDLIGHVDPSRVQFDLFKTLDRDHPIEMFNLVKLRGEAAYPDGHALAGQGTSGAEAYRRYGEHAAPIVARIGASIVWRRAFEATLIGPAGEAWDHAFIARYPTAHAFLEMISDPAYADAVVHRQAAVETSRLIRCKPSQPGVSFG